MVVTVQPNGKRVAEPCDCRDNRIYARRWAKAQIPPRYYEATLGSFERNFEGAHASLEQAHLIAKAFSDQYPGKLMIPGRGLLFSGPPGVGKTHLAIGILKVMVEEKFMDGLFCYYQQLLKEIQNSYNPAISTTELQVLEPVFTVDVLVLDDLGSVKPTDWVWDTVAMVLNTRYNHQRLTIVTTNFDNRPARSLSGDLKEQMRVDSLGDRIGDRMRSRLLEMCREVKMEGPDYRERLARSEQPAARKVRS